MSTAIFLRLLRDEDKARALAKAIAALREGHRLESMVYPVTPVSFRQVPGSPFAYWVSERIRQLFTALPPFESEGRTVKQGLATADDFRFVRVWWEVPSECVLDGANGPDWRQDLTAFQAWCRQRTFEGKRWVPFAKGGTYSPYYADLQLVVNWGRDGQEMKAWADPLYGNSGWSRIIKSVDFYFRPGLTWPLRGIRLSAQAVPSGSIFSVAGKLATSNRINELSTILALMNSKVFDFLVGLFAGKVGGVQYEVGLIGRIPLPNGFDEESLHEKAIRAYEASVRQGTGDERNHFFFLPSLLQVPGDTLAERLVAWRISVANIEQQLNQYQLEIDGVPFSLYGIDPPDRRAIEESLSGQRIETSDEEPDAGPAGEGVETEPIVGERRLVADILIYSVGCVFGRWNVCFAAEERQPSNPPDPFAPLPVCSPGMLTGEDRLPLRKVPPNYPLRIDQEGILVDDSDHPDDIVRRVREVLELLWKDHAEAIEEEACEILGVRELRDYFRRPGKGGFWDDHVFRYSKSHRKAPIYWLLQSSKKSYALWIYYHRLDKDMLFKAWEHSRFFRIHRPAPMVGVRGEKLPNTVNLGRTGPWPLRRSFRSMNSATDRGVPRFGSSCTTASISGWIRWRPM